MKAHLDYSAIYAAAVNAASKLDGSHQKVYGVPRGGIYAAMIFVGVYGNAQLIDDPEYATLIVDDVIDSGRTAKRFPSDIPFIALFGKQGVSYPANVIVGKTMPAEMWLVYPWEKTQLSNDADESISSTIRNRMVMARAPFFANDSIWQYLEPHDLPLLEEEVVGKVEDLLSSLVIDTINDHNTVGTARRVAKMFIRETFSGRYFPPPSITDFPNVKKLDEIVTTGPVAIRSTCSHHMAPIYGKCWIGVIYDQRLIGLSKFNRVVDWVFSRPQIQEEATVQLADFLEAVIAPKGLAIIVEATHTCMTQRGVKAHGDSLMKTSVMRGIFRDNPAARAEFMGLIK
jgi:GTP cyclohydrolase I